MPKSGRSNKKTVLRRKIKKILIKPMPPILLHLSRSVIFYAVSENMELLTKYLLYKGGIQNENKVKKRSRENNQRSLS